MQAFNLSFRKNVIMKALPKRAIISIEEEKTMKLKENIAEKITRLTITYIFVFVAVFLGLFALYFHITTDMSTTWLVQLLFVDLLLLMAAILKPLVDITIEFFKDILKNS